MFFFPSGAEYIFSVCNARAAVGCYAWGCELLLNLVKGTCTNMATLREEGRVSVFLPVGFVKQRNSRVGYKRYIDIFEQVFTFQQWCCFVFGI